MLERPNWSETLISRVGGANKYQVLLFIHFSLKWVLAGMILFSLNFFYVTPEFVCAQGEVPPGKTCEEFVCSVEDEKFWYDHLERPIPTSISLDYGVYMLCSKKWISSLLQSFSYMGTFIGYLVMSHFADNKGRKISELASWIINIIGLIILVTSVNLYMVGIGGFLMGLGTNAAITLHYTFLKELILGKFRERSIIALQILFSLGVSLVALLSMLITTWKIVAGVGILIPAIVVVPLSYIIEETPNFSLKKGKGHLLESLNRIAKINDMDRLAEEDLDFIDNELLEIR